MLSSAHENTAFLTCAASETSQLIPDRQIKNRRRSRFTLWIFKIRPSNAPPMNQVLNIPCARTSWEVVSFWTNSDSDPLFRLNYSCRRRVQGWSKWNSWIIIFSLNLYKHTWSWEHLNQLCQDHSNIGSLWSKSLSHRSTYSWLNSITRISAIQWALALRRYQLPTSTWTSYIHHRCHF